MCVSLSLNVCMQTYTWYVSTYIIHMYVLHTQRILLEQSVGLLVCISLSLSLYVCKHICVCKHIHINIFIIYLQTYALYVCNHTHLNITYSNVARAESCSLGVLLSLSTSAYLNIHIVCMYIHTLCIYTYITYRVLDFWCAFCPHFACHF